MEEHFRGQPAAPAEMVEVAGEPTAVPLYRRHELAAGQHLQGPAIVVEDVATTWLAAGWRCHLDSLGNLLLRLPG
jgi:N-methylhydantoinase A